MAVKAAGCDDRRTFRQQLLAELRTDYANEKNEAKLANTTPTFKNITGYKEHVRQRAAEARAAKEATRKQHRALANDRREFRKELRNEIKREKALERAQQLRQTHDKRNKAAATIQGVWRHRPILPVRHATAHYVSYTWRFRCDDQPITNYDRVLADVKTAGVVNYVYQYELQNRDTGDVTTYAQNAERKRYDRAEDLMAHLRQLERNRHTEQVQRPNTKWEFLRSVAVVVKIADIKAPLLGADLELPQFITHRADGTKNKYVIPLTGHDDRLCFFRCWALANANGKKLSPNVLNASAKRLQREWGAATGKRTIHEHDFDRWEAHTRIRLMVYEKPAEDSGWQLRRLGAPGHKETLNIGIYDDHCFFLRDIAKVSKTFVCDGCKQVFNRVDHMKRHVCAGGRTRLRFHDEALRKIPSKFQSTFNGGKTRPYPWFITWDIESVQMKGGARTENEKTTIESEHVPVSVSVADNLSGTERTIVSRDPKELVALMFEEMRKRRADIVREVTKEFGRHLTKEQLTRAAVELLTGRKFPKRRGKRNKKKNDDTADWLEGLELDCFNKETGTAVEFNGKQHYEWVPHFHKTRAEFAEQQKRDARKRELCAAHGVKLVVVPYKNARTTAELVETLAAALGCDPGGLDAAAVHEHAMRNDDKVRDYVGVVPVVGFNSSKYDLNVLKKHIVGHFQDATIANADGRFMFITTDEFKFIDAYNFLAPNYSLEKWLTAYKCTLRKSHFPYEWFDSYEKLDYPGLPPRRCWFSKLRNRGIGLRDYWACVRTFNDRGMKTFGDWLRHYNSLDTLPMLEATAAMQRVYLKDGIDILKDVCSISGVAMRCILNGAVARGFELWAPQSDEEYDLLRSGMVGGPAIIFTRLAEATKTMIRKHGTKVCKRVLGFDANALYLWCLAQLMPTGKGRVEDVAERDREELTNAVLGNKVFGFVQVDIAVPDALRDKFSEMSPLFVNTTIPDGGVPEDLLRYKEASQRKNTNATKLCGVMRAEKMLLYIPLLCWYLRHGLIVSNYYKFIHYEPARCFEWFAQDVSDARREGDQNADSQILADSAKLKGNSAYGKLIENLVRQTNTLFTDDANEIDRKKRSALFSDVTHVSDDTYEVHSRRQEVKLSRPYQCGIAVYQMAKLRMLEFYYDFMDEFVDRSDFEYLEMDTDSAYMAIAGETLEEVIKPSKRAAFERVKEDWFVHDAHSRRTPGLFKLEFAGTRFIGLTAKCYFVEDEQRQLSKASAKGTNSQQNAIKSWDRYKAALDGYIGMGPATRDGGRFHHVDMACNRGFRRMHNRVFTYTQHKLGLSAAYDKRRLDRDGIHTSPKVCAEVGREYRTDQCGLCWPCCTQRNKQCEHHKEPFPFNPTQPHEHYWNAFGLRNHKRFRARAELYKAAQRSYTAVKGDAGATWDTHRHPRPRPRPHAGRHARRPGKGLLGMESPRETTTMRVEEALKRLDTWQQHKTHRRDKRFRPVIVDHIDSQWEADLVEVQPLAEENDGFRYLITCIDVLSKFAWCEPLKTKRKEEVLEAFQRILDMGRKPESVHTDAGGEFSRAFQLWLESKGIHHFLTYGKTKAAVVRSKNVFEKGFTANYSKEKFRITEHWLAPQWPFQLLCAGGTSCGKTTVVLNLLLRYLFYEKLFLYTRSPEQSKYRLLKDYCEQTKIDATFGTTAAEIVTPEELRKGVKTGNSSDEDSDGDDDSDAEREAGRFPQTVIVVDDFMLDRVAQERVGNLMSRGRHVNCSIIFTTQCFYQVPRHIRLNCGYYMIWKMPSLREVHQLYMDVVAGELTRERFSEVFAEATRDKHDFLFIDLRTECAQLRIRQNFDGLLTLINHNGNNGSIYKKVDLMKNGVRHQGNLVQCLVARAFVPNPDKKPDVDHINGDTTDNRVENLRWVTKRENAHNCKQRTDNKSGAKGVCWDKRGSNVRHPERSKHWRATVYDDEGRQLGRYFATFDEAADWRRQKEELTRKLQTLDNQKAELSGSDIQKQMKESTAARKSEKAQKPVVDGLNKMMGSMDGAKETEGKRKRRGDRAPPSSSLPKTSEYDDIDIDLDDDDDAGGADLEPEMGSAGGSESSRLSAVSIKDGTGRPGKSAVLQKYQGSKLFLGPVPATLTATKLSLHKPDGTMTFDATRGLLELLTKPAQLVVASRVKPADAKAYREALEFADLKRSAAKERIVGRLKPEPDGSEDGKPKPKPKEKSKPKHESDRTSSSSSRRSGGAAAAAAAPAASPDAMWSRLRGLVQKIKSKTHTADDVARASALVESLKAQKQLSGEELARLKELIRKGYETDMNAFEWDNLKTAVLIAVLTLLFGRVTSVFGKTTVFALIRLAQFYLRQAPDNLLASVTSPTSLAAMTSLPSSTSTMARRRSVEQSRARSELIQDLGLEAGGRDN
eukprot:gene36402-15539_t